MRFLIAAIVGALAATSSNAAITISIYGDVAAGQAAFGTASDAFNWRNLFAPSAVWTLGTYGGPAVNLTALTDPVTGASVTSTSLNFSVTNWIDGPGFDAAGAAAPDMAISGPENFSLLLGTPTQRLGVALSVGAGLLSSEVDISGATALFAITALNGASIIGGSNEAFLNPQGGATYWLDIQGDTPFDRVTFTDINGSLADEYFGNFVTGTLPATPGPGPVPEPASWAMLIAGFGLVGATMRRRRRVSLA
jgi:hypothetical protein